MEEVLVSINCITYNQEKYIAEAIESFLMQKTNFRFEIIIHDDASTDRTADIIREYEKKYPEIIKPIIQTENQYSKGKKIFPILWSKSIGKYIALCEGDDYWTDPYKLQKQVDYMESDQHCSMSFHAAYKVNTNKKIIDIIKPYDKECISTTQDIILGDGWFMATNSILFRKCIVENVPSFYLNCPIGDYPLQILTSTRDYAYYIDEVMSAYRFEVDGSWSKKISSKKNKVEKFLSLRKKIIQMLNEFDKYSNGKYTNVINQKIIHDEIEMLIASKKINELKSKKYKAVYNSLDLKEKTKIFLRWYMPDVYARLSNIEGVIKSRLRHNE